MPINPMLMAQAGQHVAQIVARGAKAGKSNVAIAKTLTNFGKAATHSGVAKVYHQAAAQLVSKGSAVKSALK